MQNAAACLVEWFISAPLRSLFHKGPTWLGGWQGRAEADMCAEMTGSPATFWMVHAAECEDIVEKKFQSFQIVVQIVVYGYLLVTVASLIVRACIFRWTVVMPMERLLGGVTSAVSTVPRIADTCRLQTFPRPQIEAGRSPCKPLSTCTWRTAPEQNGPPH
jgi:hypothetical protein